MPVYRDGRVIGLTLDVMRRREGGWRPAIEFLIARAAQDAQARGLEMLSLSGAPLARSGPSGDLNHFGIGSCIKDGFYYDVDVAGAITEQDLLAIEAEMRRLAGAAEKVERVEMKKDKCYI